VGEREIERRRRRGRGEREGKRERGRENTEEGGRIAYLSSIFLFSVGLMPFDTIKKRMQMSGVARDVRYGEML
jgi:hypothetical protein